MKITFLASSLALLPSLSTAHGNQVPGAPKLWGRRGVQDLDSKGLVKRHQHRSMQNAARRGATPTFEEHLKPNRIKERAAANTAGQCGAGFGSCATGYCCSPAGWCGTTEDYCAAPACQFNYGPGCDTNQIPPGPATSGVARTKLGSVPYGDAGIYDCTVNGAIALTFDDGPYIYTKTILDVLEKYNVTATFFITGNNLGKGQIDNAYYPWASLIQRMHTAGHQIASHTWGHQDLGSSASVQLQDKLTQQQRLNQIYYNEIAFNNILGFFPTYLRPPYSDCDSTSGCETDLKNLGYHITYFDLDTEDYLMDSPDLIQNSKNFYLGNISSSNPSNGNWLVIGHDIHQQTAINLTEYMITTALAANWNLMTVGECLGDPSTNWYRTLGGGSLFTSAPASTVSASSTSSSPAVSATAVSTDAKCGGTSGETCQGSTFGNCCSPNGWCGSTSDYCGTGCQPAFGSCGSGSSSVSSKSTSTTSTSSQTSSTSSKTSSTSSTTSKTSSTSSTTSKTSTSSTTSKTSTTSTTSSSSTKTSSNATASPSALVVSTDGACGGTSGETCLTSTFGNCCSQYGWCGSTTAYCGTGCQSKFGTCT